MSSLVLDVETIAAPGDEDRQVAIQEMFEKGPDEWFDTAESFAALSPALARIVSIAFEDAESGKRMAVYDEMCGKAEQTNAHQAMGEADLLKRVNGVVANARRIVSFRGRNFDVPCLVHGMVANQIPPCGLLLASFRESRYHTKAHIDLWDQFTMFGASHGHGGATLRAWAMRYGFPDPKAGGGGEQVAGLVSAQRATELVAYNLADAAVTAELYRSWKRLMLDAGNEARS
jgi:hypothetical protein